MISTLARLKLPCLTLVALISSQALASDGISLVRVLEPNSQARDVAVSPDGNTAAISNVSGLQFWDLTTGNILELIDEDAGGCGLTQQSHDGRLLVLGCRESSFVLDFVAREVVAEIETPYIRFAAFDRAQKRLATMVLDSNNSYSKTQDAHFAIYDIEGLTEPSWFGSFVSAIFGYEELDPEEEFSIPEPKGMRSFTLLQFSSTQDRLVVSDSSTVFRLSFDGKKQEQSPRAMAKEAPYLCGGKNIVVVDSVAMRNTTEEIDTRNRSPQTRFINRYPICRFRRDMSEAVFAYGGQLGAWNIATGKERWHYDERPDAHHIDITPDGSVIAIGSSYHELALLDADGTTIASGRIDSSALSAAMARYRRCDDHFQRLTLSADGRTMLYNDCAIFVLRRQ